MSDEVVDFDEYVENYEELLEGQLAFFNSQRDYFSAYKVELLSKVVTSTPKRILDFGCGIGLSLPHLSKYFPKSKIYGSDISKKSLEYVREKFPTVHVTGDLKDYQEAFDLVFLAGVVHHVPPKERPQLMKEVERLIRPGGTLCIFEHNPYNPITRRIVSNCPFDKGVILLPPKELAELMKGVKIDVINRSYCLFFPHFLRGLRTVEQSLGWLPFGGQYYVVGEKGSA